MVEKRPSLWLFVVLVVVILVGAAVGAGLLYYLSQPKGGSGPLTVQLGDNVTVNYVGLFGSSPQAGRVFDTSIYSVATNDQSYPKSLEYTPRPNASSYTPLPVHVGPSAPSSGYSYAGQSFITVVTGFWQGLIGLPGNQTSYLYLPPALAYGPANPACFLTAPLSYTLPVLVTLSPTAFKAAYPNGSAQQGSSFLNPTYQWPMYVVSANQTAVVVQNQPSVGWTATPNSWPVEVMSVNATTISLTNQLNSANDGLEVGHVPTAECGQNAPSHFLVSSVDVAGGTYTQDFNSETTNETLIFVVTVVDIYP